MLKHTVTEDIKNEMTKYKENELELIFTMLRKHYTSYRWYWTINCILHFMIKLIDNLWYYENTTRLIFMNKNLQHAYSK